MNTYSDSDCCPKCKGLFLHKEDCPFDLDFWEDECAVEYEDYHGSVDWDSLTHTGIIAGQKVTLFPNKRYIASRPIAQPGIDVFPISISDSTGKVVQVIGGLGYDEANQFLNEFNNETTSFTGRVW